MRVEHHAAVSVLFSGLLLGLLHSWPMALGALISGIVMDVDHIPDYLFHFGFRFNVRRFFQASYEREYKRVFILLHSWEWLPLGLLLAWWSGWNPWLVGLLLGWVQHMSLDQIVNKPRRMGYFLLGRWRADFDHDLCFPQTEAILGRSKKAPPDSP
jgi:hypothetical protein